MIEDEPLGNVSNELAGFFVNSKVKKEDDTDEVLSSVKFEHKEANRASSATKAKPTPAGKKPPVKNDSDMDDDEIDQLTTARHREPVTSTPKKPAASRVTPAKKPVEEDVVVEKLKKPAPAPRKPSAATAAKKPAPKPTSQPKKGKAKQTSDTDEEEQHILPPQEEEEEEEEEHEQVHKSLKKVKHEDEDDEESKHPSGMPIGIVSEQETQDESQETKVPVLTRTRRSLIVTPKLKPGEVAEDPEPIFDLLVPIAVQESALKRALDIAKYTETSSPLVQLASGTIDKVARRVHLTRPAMLHLARQSSLIVHKLLDYLSTHKDPINLYDYFCEEIVTMYQNQLKPLNAVEFFESVGNMVNDKNLLAQSGIFAPTDRMITHLNPNERSALLRLSINYVVEKVIGIKTDKWITGADLSKVVRLNLPKNRDKDNDFLVQELPVLYLMQAFGEVFDEFQLGRECKITVARKLVHLFLNQHDLLINNVCRQEAIHLDSTDDSETKANGKRTKTDDGPSKKAKTESTKETTKVVLQKNFVDIARRIIHDLDLNMLRETRVDEETKVTILCPRVIPKHRTDYTKFLNLVKLAEKQNPHNVHSKLADLFLARVYPEKIVDKKKVIMDTVSMDLVTKTADAYLAYELIKSSSPKTADVLRSAFALNFVFNCSNHMIINGERKTLNNQPLAGDGEVFIKKE